MVRGASDGLGRRGPAAPGGLLSAAGSSSPAGRAIAATNSRTSVITSAAPRPTVCVPFPQPYRDRSRHGAPRITKDGVTVAKEIELSDKFENMGAQTVREVASQSSSVAGDGTTTATILAHVMVREGVKAVAAGMNPMDLKRGVDMAVDAVVKDIQKRLPHGFRPTGRRIALSRT